MYNYNSSSEKWLTSPVCAPLHINFNKYVKFASTYTLHVRYIGTQYFALESSQLNRKFFTLKRIKLHHYVQTSCIQKPQHSEVREKLMRSLCAKTILIKFRDSSLLFIKSLTSKFFSKWQTTMFTRLFFYYISRNILRRVSSLKLKLSRDSSARAI